MNYPVILIQIKIRRCWQRTVPSFPDQTMLLFHQYILGGSRKFDVTILDVKISRSDFVIPLKTKMMNKR